MKKLLFLFLATVTLACSSGDDSSDNNDPQNNDPNNNVPPTCDVVYLDANGVTIKACPDAQVGESGEINGITYTVVDASTLREMVQNGDDVTRVCTSRITNMEEMFGGGTFNQNIGHFDVSSVNNIDNMFLYNSQFNQDLEYWDVSNVVTMRGVFENASNFNGNISTWDVSNVTDFYRMFQSTLAFNSDISNWDVSAATSMYQMFRTAQVFNQDLSQWDVENVTSCIDFDLITPQWTLPKPNFTNCTP